MVASVLFLIQRSPDITGPRHITPSPSTQLFSVVHTQFYDTNSIWSTLILLIYTAHHPHSVPTSLLPGLESTVQHQNSSFANILHFLVLFLYESTGKTQVQFHPFVPLLHGLLQLADWLYFKCMTKTLKWAFSITQQS